MAGDPFKGKEGQKYSLQQALNKLVGTLEAL